MPSDVIPLSHTKEWEPREKDIKNYIHFDRRIGSKKLKKICNDPDLVAKHAFYPLLRFSQEWIRFRGNGSKKVKKKRPIRYAARLDAAIFAKYRSDLSDLYEKELVRRGLEDVPTAYRRIPKDNSGGNKSNIELARDVFDFIRDVEDCVVTVVDISSFFEKIDHSKLKKAWIGLLAGEMPPDHSAVFKAVTKYSVVDFEPMAARLGLYKSVNGTNRYAKRKRRIDEMRDLGHTQICSNQDFRRLICGGSPQHPSLIQKNNSDFGIPQGTPISDLLANIYLLDFDERMHHWATKRHGIYRRYSDDIVLIVPSCKITKVLEVKELLQSEISREGAELQIKDKKVAVCRFSANGSNQAFSHIFGEASKNGLEYLGFQFDGKRVSIKDSTLSNAWRKLKRRSYGFARRYVRRYRGKGQIWIIENYPFNFLIKKFLLKVTYGQDIGYEVWTFRSYVRRASNAFSGYETIFSKQTKKYRSFAEDLLTRDLNLALRRHFKK
ncbi:reverse transcriptase domain-containing protein [Oricola indica]|uniref:reverse transcriptase domain-containing protein n=1 Tax=Oricola indica TaxID=2872591 RepID=UPI003CCBCECA